jgi:hypothetical protein
MRMSALERPEAPLARSLLSSSVTLTPREASAHVVLTPTTAPPITTTSAVSAITPLLR